MVFQIDDVRMETIYNTYGSGGKQFTYSDDSESEEEEEKRKDEDDRKEVVKRSQSPASEHRLVPYNTPQMGRVHTIANKEALLNSTREQLVQCLSAVNVVSPPPPMVMLRQGTPPIIRRSSKERMVQSVALRRQDHETSNVIVIDTVAWMIVLGDALLNFIDGLSIGAAFDRNILAGMSISVAVMLEEVTHRLGTFAVLIRAGMSMKQSFLYIFLSACACYPGLALGIFLGDEAEEQSPYIFALAG